MVKYENPTPVVVGVIRSHLGGYVAIQRGDHSPNSWAFPGGYVDKGETAETAIAREVYEETGTMIAPDMWRPFRTHVTPNNQLLIFMKTSAVFTERNFNYFCPNAEALGIRAAFSGETLCFELHTKVLRGLE